MIVPAVLTAAVLGGLYYNRQPVRASEGLTENRRYRFAVVTNPQLLEADPRRAAAGTGEALVKATLEQMGFTDVRYVSTQVVPAEGEMPGNVTYWFDGRWSLPQTTIPTPPVNWIAGASFYPKYFGVV